MTIEIFLLNFFKICDKMAISAYIFEKSRKDGVILRPQIRARDTFS